jgi:NitT/TauT family transport system substrate-binding protein
MSWSTMAEHDVGLLGSDIRTCDALGALPLPLRERAGVRGSLRKTPSDEEAPSPVRLRVAKRRLDGRPLPQGERWSKRLGRLTICIVSTFFLLGVITAASAEPLRVGKAGREAFSFVPADIGQRTGLFKKHGVDIEISNFGGDARLQQAMAADGIDIALGSGPGLAFVVKGSPVKGIAAMAGPPLLFALVVRNDGSIKSIDDLKGRNVGVSTVGSVTSWLVNEVSRQNGWGLDGMPLVPIGENATRIAALKTKAVDGCVVDIASALNFVQRGEGRILMRFGGVVQDFILHVIFATDKAIATKPEALRGFLSGWFDTITFMRQNKRETVEIAQEVMGTDAQTTAGIYDELMPMFSDTGRFDPKALAVLSKSFVEMKTLPQEPDMGRLYTEAFLPKSGGAMR